MSRASERRRRHLRFWGLTSLVCSFIAFATFFGGAVFLDAGMKTHAIVAYASCFVSFACSLLAIAIGTDELT